MIRKGWGKTFVPFLLHWYCPESPKVALVTVMLLLYTPSGAPLRNQSPGSVSGSESPQYIVY